jgi:site-specific DNA-methyltransferase (adenine-specific)
VKDRGVPDVWRHKTGGYKPDGHPAQKPVALVERVLATAGLQPGQTVLEPFAGSGTTAVAAKAMGLRCIAIEAETKWCDLTAARLAQDVLAFD